MDLLTVMSSTVLLQKHNVPLLDDTTFTIKADYVRLYR